MPLSPNGPERGGRHAAQQNDFLPPFELIGFSSRGAFADLHHVHHIAPVRVVGDSTGVVQRVDERLVEAGTSDPADATCPLTRSVALLQLSRKMPQAL